jgi:hypothetical protein
VQTFFLYKREACNFIYCPLGLLSLFVSAVLFVCFTLLQQCLIAGKNNFRMGFGSLQVV